MRPSASQLDRALKCPVSNFLPKVQEEAGPYAERGTALHSYLAKVVSGTDHGEALKSVPTQYQDAADAINLGRLPIEDGFRILGVELSGCYDPDRGLGKILGTNTNRDYSKVSESEFPFTADLAGFSRDGKLHIIDWKTGYSDYAGRAKDSWQLRLCGLGIVSAIGYSGEVVLGFHNTEGEGYTDSFSISSHSMADWQQELKSYVRRVDLGTESYVNKHAVVGAYCKYCPSYSYCPATTNLIRTLAHTGGIDGLLTKDNVAKAYVRYRQVKLMLEKVEAALKGYASQEGPIELENGKFYGERDASAESLDGKVVYQVISELHGKDVAQQAVSIEATKESLAKALKPIAPRGKHAGMVREALRRIAELGGVSVSRKTRFEEYRSEASGVLDADVHGAKAEPVVPGQVKD